MFFNEDVRKKFRPDQSHWLATPRRVIGGLESSRRKEDRPKYTDFISKHEFHWSAS